VPTVSLHVHERIDPRTIIEAVRREPDPDVAVQMSLFQAAAENPPLRHAIEFYKHAHGWSNRLIAGDSLLVMNSLLEKEGLAGQVQMIYIDPPYGIKYGSNFQPFVNKRDVRDGRDDDLTAEPEQIRAFRDTWELGIHSYLTYLRDRLLLARELLTDTGSVFVQISDENVHHVRELLDEVFGHGNFISIIPFIKTSGKGGKTLDSVNDYLIWYAREKARLKYRQLYKYRTKKSLDQGYTWIELPDGARRRLTQAEIRGRAPIPVGRRFISAPTNSQSGGENSRFEVKLDGKVFVPTVGYWKTNPEGMDRLKLAGRLIGVRNTLSYVRYSDDFPVVRINNWWGDTRESTFAANKFYVVQTYTKVIERCLLMATDPGDLIFDPTCGSGTTAYVAEKWGRRWITCDTSRVAITLAKQRLMTGVFDYYELAYPEEGVGSGFVYKTVPHIMLKTITTNPYIKEGMSRKEIEEAIARYAPQETLYDQPQVDSSKQRVTGPFTVEAVPAPAVRSVDELLETETAAEPLPADMSIARSGETLRQAEWRDELLQTGIRGKAGQRIRFARLEPLPGCRYLHADGESRPNDDGADSVKEAGAAYPQRIGRLLRSRARPAGADGRSSWPWKRRARWCPSRRSSSSPPSSSTRRRPRISTRRTGPA
jgi:adenine-specific DNA-methyltransferase